MKPNDKAPRIAITTLGCKVNQYESAGISAALAAQGATLVPFEEPADIYVINTCTVTEKTDAQSRQLISRANRMNPKADIVVTGCYAQMAAEVISRLPGVQIVVGTDQKEKLPHRILSLLAERQDIQEQPQILVTPDMTGGFDYRNDTCLTDHTRAFLKIQDGCDAFCSYCIVPYARGRSRSLDPDSVLRRLKALAAKGFREIVLTGVHLGMYGLDLESPADLLTLLQMIEASDIDLPRLRLSSIEPTEITDALIAHIAASRMICPHFHIPMQSGSNKILTAMKRCYNNQAFKNIVLKILEIIPDAGIGIDVMAGFPGEDDRDFQDTVDFIINLHVAYLHVFPYSRRSGTEAADYPGQLRETVKKERARFLRNLGRQKRHTFEERFIGKRLTVLIEKERDRETGLMKGFSGNYIPVLIANSNDEPVRENHLSQIIGIGICEDKLLGRFCDE